MICVLWVPPLARAIHKLSEMNVPKSPLHRHDVSGGIEKKSLEYNHEVKVAAEHEAARSKSSEHCCDDGGTRQG